ncbi:nuclear transport factor 2 family protein [Sporolactobacillus pectinivorans]|uniref:nuclear transport factor 2 family protein n=1 Tax=Sporolactobacillus pectinivorans TaxID=1591408 RepID=UPI001EFD8C8D|nr:nuclear transport factor 2 family protein [Sporolactobacillus pectinivorans]
MKKSEIIECEKRLQEAMLSSDVTALDELIDDDLIFVDHFGQILTKENDLETTVWSVKLF